MPDRSTINLQELTLFIKNFDGVFPHPGSFELFLIHKMRELFYVANDPILTYGFPPIPPDVNITVSMFDSISQEEYLEKLNGVMLGYAALDYPLADIPGATNVVGAILTSIRLRI